jgi:N-acetyltransferase
MRFNPQPTLSDELLLLQPLQADDFERLYAVAADPLLWAQHPNPDRWQRPVFENFFRGAMESGGALLILHQATGAVMGSSRFYDWEQRPNAVFIGYTFFGRQYWGGRYNPAAKRLMVNYALQSFERVLFHVGANNVRSQKAMERLGAQQIAIETVAYYGEPDRVNVLYEITGNL